MLNNLTINFFILVLTFSITSAQNIVTDSTATVVGYWGKGEKKILTIQHDRVKYENEVLTYQEGSTYEAFVTIVDSTENSYTIEWAIKNVQTSRDANPLVKALVKMTENLKIIYKTDELGTFSELINWEEMKNFLNTALEKMHDELNDSPEFINALNKVKEMFTTKAAIEQIMIREIQIYHTPYGLEYKLNEKLALETQLPNIFGGEPFPAVLNIELTEINPEENSCRLTMSTEMDEEKATEIVFDFVKKLAEQMGKPLPDLNELPVFAIHDTCAFEVDLISGWLTRAYYKRKVQNDLVKQIDNYEIKLNR